MKNKHYQIGLSLIEVMIALLLGAFLVGGVLQIFIGSKQTYRMQENLSRLQENGRLAMDLIGRDIRMTSYWGCLVRASGDITGGDSTITLKAAFVTTPTGACGTTVDITAPYYCATASTIRYLINNAILQKITGTSSCAANSNSTNDLIEGIENMQILYGEDMLVLGNYDGWANYYVLANNVVNWEKVVSIRISLLAVTLDDNLTPQPMPFTFNGITTNDRKIRRVFTSTIALRNRLP
jgi:type IV pilus assembly protein PilW